LNFIRYLLRLRHYKRQSVEDGVFQMGWITSRADFKGKGVSPTNHCWRQSIAELLPFRVVSKYLQCITIHACDRQTDGRIELGLPRPPSHMFAR